MLEYHPDILTDFINIHMFIRHIKTIHNNRTVCRHFELIQAPQKGGFTASGRSKKNNDLAFLDIHTYIF